MRDLTFMGEDQPEAFRCRIYTGDDPLEKQRRGFLTALENGGVIDCEAYDVWIESLDARGWLTSELEPHPEVSGAKAKRWRLSDVGREAWGKIKETSA